MKKFIMLVAFLTLFCISVPVLALDAPTLTLTTSGINVSLSWTSVTGATGYTLFYAPYPDASSIGQIDMGTQTSLSFDANGLAFYGAIQSYNNSGSSEYSNIEYFDLSSSDPTFTNSLGMTFVSIPAGTFTMGSPEDELGRDSYETQHQVTLTQGYYMQTTEVTQGQWEAVMGSNPSYYSDCGTICPVEDVSWDEVQEFINELNQLGEGTYSLPTEAQWEYAARAGSTTAFANGEITGTGVGYDPNLDAMGWYLYNSDDEAHPVAQKTPNAWGLYDMHGNVYEWCQDWYDSYISESVTDPAGPSSGSYRVLRGGSWYSNAQDCRSALRYNLTPGGSISFIGFRLVLLSPGQQ
jgi:formylglycine-generating enzyme required for sulfatase activity